MVLLDKLISGICADRQYAIFIGQYCIVMLCWLLAGRKIVQKWGEENDDNKQIKRSQNNFLLNFDYYERMVLGYIICVLIYLALKAVRVERPNNNSYELLNIALGSFVGLVTIWTLLSKWKIEKGIIPAYKISTYLHIQDFFKHLMVCIIIMCIATFTSRVILLHWVFLVYLFLFFYIVNIFAGIMFSSYAEKRVLFSLYQNIEYSNYRNPIELQNKNDIQEMLDILVNEYLCLLDKIEISMLLDLKYGRNFRDKNTMKRLAKRSFWVMAVIDIDFIVVLLSKFGIDGENYYIIVLLNVLFVVTAITYRFKWMSAMGIILIYNFYSYEFKYKRKHVYWFQSEYKYRYVCTSSIFSNNYIRYINVCKSIYVFYNMAKEAGRAKEVKLFCKKKVKGENAKIEALFYLFRDIDSNHKSQIMSSDIKNGYAKCVCAILDDIHRYK